MKTKLFAASLLALGAAFATAGTAHATIFAGTATFTDAGPGNNGLTLSAPDATISNLNLALNTPLTINNFMAVTFTDSTGSFFGSTATDTVYETFAFTLPSTGTGTVNGSGTDTVYTNFQGHINGADGSITWSNPGVVNFADGAVLDISLSNESFDVNGNHSSQTVSVDATFKMVQDVTAVPEPVSMALLGVGLLGVGMIRRQRRSS